MTVVNMGRRSLLWAAAHRLRWWYPAIGAVPPSAIACLIFLRLGAPLRGALFYAALLMAVFWLTLRAAARRPSPELIDQQMKELQSRIDGTSTAQPRHRRTRADWVAGLVVVTAVAVALFVPLVVSWASMVRWPLLLLIALLAWVWRYRQDR